jgi:hypothetical protein
MHTVFSHCPWTNTSNTRPDLINGKITQLEKDLRKMEPTAGAKT